MRVVALLILSARVAVAAPRVAIPDFELEGMPPFAAVRVPDLVAAALAHAGCVSTMREHDFGATTSRDLDGCLGNTACVASLGARLGVEHVLLGVATLDGSIVQLELADLRVPERRVAGRRFLRYPGGLANLGAALKADPRLCDPYRDSAGDLPLADVTPAADDSDLELDLPAPVVATRVEPSASTVVASAAPPPPSFEPIPLPPMDVIEQQEPNVAPATVQPAQAAPVVTRTNAAPSAVAPPVLAPPPTRLLPRSPFARRVFVGTAVVAGLAAVGGAGFGAASLSSVQERSAASDALAFRAAQAEAESRALGANVLFTVAGAALVAAVTTYVAGDSLFASTASPRP